MVAIDKLIEKMRRSPQSDWVITDIQRVANKYEIEWRSPSGSHVIFFHEGIKEQISIPAKRPIKPIYIKRFIAFLDELVAQKENHNET